MHKAWNPNLKVEETESSKRLVIISINDQTSFLLKAAEVRPRNGFEDVLVRVYKGDERIRVVMTSRPRTLPSPTPIPLTAV